MMKKVKSITFTILSGLLIFLLSTEWNYENSAALGSIASFLSITTGFTITALSIIATSPFSKNLYKLEDKADNSKTLLHVLVDKFKSATYIFITTISLILLYSFLDNLKWKLLEIFEYKITFPDCLKALVWYFTIISLWYFITLIKLFSKFVIRSSTQ